MTAISKLQFSPFRANFCHGWAKPLIYACSSLPSVFFSTGQTRVYRLVSGQPDVRFQRSCTSLTKDDDCASPPPPCYLGLKENHEWCVCKVGTK